MSPAPQPWGSQPRNRHGRVCAGHSTAGSSHHRRLARGGSEDPSPVGAPGTSTQLRRQQPITKQMPPHSPSPHGCTPGGSNKTQPLLEPLWPMQTGMCNESMSPYWHRVVQVDVHPLWAPHPSSPPFQHTQKARAGQDRAVPARGTFRWQQMEHMEVPQLGQTLSAVTGLGDLVLPSSAGIRR